MVFLQLAFDYCECIFTGHLIDVGEIIRGSFVGLWSSVHEVIVRDGGGDLFTGIEKAAARAGSDRLASGGSRRYPARQRGFVAKFNF
jgi:hypothetical protein